MSSKCFLKGKKWSLPTLRHCREFDKKLPLFVLVQSTVSSTSSHTLFLWNHTKKLSTTSTSQSLKDLEKQGSHPHKYPPRMPLLSQLKQTSTRRTRTKENPHITYPSKISHFAYYPVRKRSYYSQDLNPSLSLSTT